MNHITNLRTVNTVHNYTPFTHSAAGLVREVHTGYQLPQADAYAKRIADEAEAWTRFAAERSLLRPASVTRKALHAVAATLRYRANSLLVPSKLSGTSRCQPALWSLAKDRIPFAAAFEVTEVESRLAVAYEGVRLGFIQDKHRWVRPLVPFGLEVRLGRVSGLEHDRYTLGLNILFTGAGAAVAALNHALGLDVRGDGCGGDGAAGVASQAPVQPAAVEVHALPDHGGDGLAADPEDVVLYRGIDGTAHATVGHVPRNSPSGIEWGYGGSGPADLARSILLAFTDETTADRLCVRFKEEIVAAVPRAGGVIRAADVRAWLASRRADSR